MFEALGVIFGTLGLTFEALGMIFGYWEGKRGLWNLLPLVLELILEVLGEPWGSFFVFFY